MAILPIDTDILSPTDDHIFKTTVTHPDAKIALMDIISGAIEKNVVDVIIRNNELPVLNDNEKNLRMDVNCTIDDGSQINIEMYGSHVSESDNQHTNLINKTLYYVTSLHSSQKSKGLKYRDLTKTYQIAFCNYTVYPHKDRYITRGSFREDDGTQISDQVNIIIVELSKLEKLLNIPVQELTSLDAWSLFFRYAAEPKHRKLLNQIISEREAIAVATNVLLDISQDEDQRASYLTRRKNETDRVSDLLTAEHRAMLRAARSLKSKGVSSEIIADSTGLSMKEIQEL